MISLSLMALVLTGTDTLEKVNVAGMVVKAPTQWKLSAQDANSRTWSSADGEAEFAISAFPVEPQRPAKGCVDQLVAALSPPPASSADGGAAEPAAGSFDRISLGAQPAAKKVTTDYVGDGEAAKVDANKVTTTTVVGCNGRTKWVATWASKTRSGARFGPLLKRVLESIEYGK